MSIMSPEPLTTGLRKPQRLRIWFQFMNSVWWNTGSRRSMIILYYCQSIVPVFFCRPWGCLVDRAATWYHSQRKSNWETSELWRFRTLTEWPVAERKSHRKSQRNTKQQKEKVTARKVRETSHNRKVTDQKSQKERRERGKKNESEKDKHVMLECHFSWQAQYVVTFQCCISSQGHYCWTVRLLFLKEVSHEALLEAFCASQGCSVQCSGRFIRFPVTWYSAFVLCIARLRWINVTILIVFGSVGLEQCVPFTVAL